MEVDEEKEDTGWTKKTVNEENIGLGKYVEEEKRVDERERRKKTWER